MVTTKHRIFPSDSERKVSEHPHPNAPAQMHLATGMVRYMGDGGEWEGSRGHLLQGHSQYRWTGCEGEFSREQEERELRGKMLEGEGRNEGNMESRQKLRSFEVECQDVIARFGHLTGIPKDVNYARG
ncbi:hypothetical protein N7509_004593 [Penicillium cosmopolitanum]|uniref:Uncharacterized protein n=1 Tax=Penicillium cosmopolitanum TaxID=1131564 RepID=A0A9X0B982_9EURO|nr:uncharacterized protein N7509_004593 [Penicillium cosmopolitanum]KAJ5396480.1 hypothetical protein N7509_004593 [Penicillium cosmopolitanum]